MSPDVECVFYWWDYVVLFVVQHYLMVSMMKSFFIVMIGWINYYPMRRDVDIDVEMIIDDEIMFVVVYVLLWGTGAHVKK